MNLDYKKVLVGVSGGVDSSVCIDLLQKQGLEVEGVVIKFSPSSDEAVEDARKVCDKLGIKLHVADAQEAFRKYVVETFCENYVKGMTPNPCIVCNPNVKFATLIAKADELGIGYIATGHYAQVENIDGWTFVKKAVSLAKDQSYMLYRLPQHMLKRLILPIGSYEKPDIRTMAGDIGLFNADKPDSQEICFIPDGNHSRFIESLGYKTKYGWLISPEGKRLKRHSGVHNYTVGQRKGLDLPMGRRVFVTELRPETNEVVIGEGNDVFGNVLYANKLNWMGMEQPTEKIEVDAKIRYNHKGAKCIVEMVGEDLVRCFFPEPVRAITPGQAVVFYDGDIVLGGGTIIGTRM